MIQNKQIQNELFLKTCAQLAAFLRAKNESFEDVKLQAQMENPFFTVLEINRMIDSILANYLAPNKLSNWVLNYEISYESRKTVGIIAAGNIPLVSFHDVLCCLVCGFDIQLKLSTKDSILSKYIFTKLNEFNQSKFGKIVFVDKLLDIDCIIATGSELATNHFRKYLEKYPCLIRSHRNSLAILSGMETEEELILLGNDIFAYYGLGCRNVCHLWLPKLYPLEKLIRICDNYFGYVKNNFKYCNNYDFQFATLCLNKKAFLQGETLLWIEDSSFHPALATIHYSYYSNMDELVEILNSKSEVLQCISSNSIIKEISVLKLGKNQEPELLEYQDKIDTVSFLLKIQ